MRARKWSTLTDRANLRPQASHSQGSRSKAPAGTWRSNGSSCAATKRMATSAASLRLRLVSATRLRRCSRSS
eukprot:9096637-Alexandrium_andersonii.AAC.2